MRRFSLVLFTVILLAGCGDTVADLKEAAAGINSKANEAASAISIDVHFIRATEIEFDNQTFTINDLFKTILRDVEWNYDDSGETQQLKITGTWQNNGLFAQHSFSAYQKELLKENGEVEVILSFNNGTMDETKTKVSMIMDGETLIKEVGQEILHHLYKTYTQILL
ncbi:23S rRNA methyltransferase [Solibacillus isronensis]|uniref:23S rRNA methyltransferase n=1 Tax=Solibacillus isronensis TaxID=412383 RepID=UPI00203F1B55|nr:23S rRNA methyltransferase [Solibacillus isronensis]MCM3720783.1 23S rRNA methyltransferase [Solibacillus isronensis]